MGLFALSVLIGALIAVGTNSENLTTAKQWITDHIITLTVASGLLFVIYTILWMHFSGIVAPSKEFRLASFFIRAIAVTPLMAAAAAVGFESVRWLGRVNGTEEKNVVSHGISIGAAGLVVLGLFLFQDDKLFGVISSVKTPVFTVDVAARSQLPPLLIPNAGPQKLDVDDEDDDPVHQSTDMLIGLAAAIARDFDYAEKLGTDRIPSAIRDPIESDRKFYNNTIDILGSCIKGIRQRVHDTDPLIFFDREVAHQLRTANRRLIDGDRTAFAINIQIFLMDSLPKILERIELRHQQHLGIEPLFQTKSDLTPCVELQNLRLIRDIWGYVWNGGISADSPIFRLLLPRHLT